MASEPPHPQYAACQGEQCRCGDPAGHKVEESFLVEQLVPMSRGMRPPRHPYTAYVCCRCFRALFGPAVPCGAPVE
jgi:hypothetical protein